MRTAKAGNEEDGFSEALLGVAEEGWFPIRVRASGFEAAVVDGKTNQDSSKETVVGFDHVHSMSSQARTDGSG
ncbi:hypothetical protein [Haladaptatus sp. CMSO5]|uniref:hypothetical protein n=1 Tax=Haladaptatus sp. CMSO5 TaxID=3120514 RepID=UPI002FCE4E1E